MEIELESTSGLGWGRELGVKLELEVEKSSVLEWEPSLGLEQKMELKTELVSGLELVGTA